MFKFSERYEVECIRCYNEEELQEIANRYKDYLKDEEKYLEEEIEDTIDTFSDYVIENEYFTFHDSYYYDFIDSNIEEFYNEVKKYM